MYAHTLPGPEKQPHLCDFFFLFFFLSRMISMISNFKYKWSSWASMSLQRFSRAGPRGRAREWATLGVHPLSWLLSNNRLEEVCGTLTEDTFSSRLLLSNQDKGCTPSVAHSLPLPPGFCSTCQVYTHIWLCMSHLSCSISCKADGFAIRKSSSLSSSEPNKSSPSDWAAAKSVSKLLGFTWLLS